jgi:hypothetical protein
MSHVAWTEIEGAHNVRKSVHKYPELLGGKSQVTYRAKVKLHGTNGGVKITPEGRVLAMSRSSIVTPTSDNAGFAKWVEANEAAFATLSRPSGDVIVYGEWAGPGIQKGVALNQLKSKIFAVFAIRLMRAGGDELVVDPTEIDDYFRFIGNDSPDAPDMHIIPWFNDGEEFTIDWAAESAILSAVLGTINDRVASVEACDPFVKSVFGIEGTGEGLVFYPVGTTHSGYKKFGDLGFKAKGEKHKMVKKTKPAQADPAAAANALAFAEMVLTDARLEQGARAASGGELQFEPRLMGPFLAWCGADVKKECGDELEASGLDWKAVSKPVADTARKWYMERVKAV